MNAISKAIKHFGTQAALAKACGITQSSVSQYLLRQKRPSAEIALEIEAATGGAVRAEELRPDVSWHVIRDRKS